MDPVTEPSDPDIRLPRDVYYVLIHTLRATLPPPAVDTQQEIARRDNAAIAQVAAMLPANADEANLAAVCVGARTYGMDCLRQARAFTLSDPMWARRCSAEAASMMRESRQARALLLRLQTVREQREKDSAATDRAAWSEHCSIGLMTRALAEAPPEPPPPAPEPDAPELPARELAEEAAPRDLAADAERYAILHPRRARLIRSLGGLPDHPDFGPPDPELVHAIATGTTPELRALDAEASHRAVT
jgi:hypothetical protein